MALSVGTSPRALCRIGTGQRRVQLINKSSGRAWVRGGGGGGGGDGGG